MKLRSIEEIEKAFREMGISEASWNKTTVSRPPTVPAQVKPEPQVFIRIETTTTPRGRKHGADLA